MFRSLFALWALTIALVAAAPQIISQSTSPCNAETMQIRKDFERLPPAERKEFTDAIKCLMTQPSIHDQAEFPGAINRFFSWAVVHISRTPFVHLDGFFLTWHRMFIHLFEQDLKNLCGFQGALPYWNWPSTAGKLENSTIFSGDEYSMSGNGLYVDQGPYQLGPNFSLPHGSGGGCVTTGPFAYMNYTMAPIFF